MNIASLPHLNATLNAASGILVLAGLAAIRSRHVGWHLACMLGALAVSGVFLTSYLIYHAQAGAKPFAGSGWTRPAYFAVLITHSVLAAVILPMALRTAFLGVRRRLGAHVRLARWTAPVWLYVSVSGIVVYVLLYHWRG